MEVIDRSWEEHYDQRFPVRSAACSIHDGYAVRGLLYFDEAWGKMILCHIQGSSAVTWFGTRENLPVSDGVWPTLLETSNMCGAILHPQ